MVSRFALEKQHLDDTGGEEEDHTYRDQDRNDAPEGVDDLFCLVMKKKAHDNLQPATASLRRLP